MRGSSGSGFSYSRLAGDDERHSPGPYEVPDMMENQVHSEERRKKMWKEKSYRIRNLISFWIFGLCNNFAYVVMLSAAHDILADESSKSKNSTGVNETEWTSNYTGSTPTPNSDYLQCNPTGTGAILLADILPTLIIKSTVPFFIQKVPYNVKLILISLFATGSFIIVALAQHMWLSIIGVVCASVTGGLGEITFLSLSTFYDRDVISTWSSGTGGAGVFGALAYAGFTSAGLSPRTTLLIMIVIPVAMLVTYFFVLTKPLKDDSKKTDGAGIENQERNEECTTSGLTLKEKLKLIPPLFKYMIPLTLVYFAEYFINQGLHELMYFNGEWLSKKEQYRWYQVDYQIGVFISRSSVNVFHIKKLWLLPLLQFANMIIFIFHVFYRFIPNIWIIFALVLWEGLLGGAAYVNTFYRMSKDIPANVREYSIGVATLGDSVGIAVAGAIAVPVHDHICGMKLKIR